MRSSIRIVDVDSPGTWTRWRAGLCDSCQANCCTMPLEVRLPDLVRLGLVDAFEAEHEEPGRIAKRLMKARLIDHFNHKHAVFTIAVPTTAGTAAEVTINYVITDVEKKRMFVCVDTNDIPEIAVVDPDMMSSMPKGLTAATGMDALTHAIEGYITKGHCVISDMFHLEAIKLISQSLRGAVQNTPEGREGMALGQYIAGMGFSNVGLGIVHSMAHGLSALYDTPHGVACAILLPVGLEYNKSVAGERYRAVGKAMGVMGIDEMNDVEAADATIAAVKQLSADVGIPANLHGILKEEDIQFLAESAFADACRPGNPRDTSVEEIVELYKSQL